jgi:tetratricopeptide (TPR) repeat protein
MRTALDLAPDSLPINADMCQVLYFTQRFDEAEMQCKNVLELNPRFLNANLYLYDVYTAKGMYDEAVAQFFKIEAIAPNYAAFPRDVAELKDAYASGGIRAFWQKRIEMLEKLPSMNYAIAVYQARLGDNDKALAQLKTAHEKHDLNFLYFLSEPLFLNCCYSDPRYQELQQSMAGHKGRGY